ncbi:MAG: NADH-quinone oxidoreductase subunit NuoG [Fimbriimonas sp.]|nr:NADH-quinone oxidoreductase subunit NuoG [Fimbriimonas sp.]
MAAVADVQTVNISINDIPLQVPKGEMVVESVKRIGLEIPIFCYHPRLKPVGMCRMCLIECAYKMPDGSVRKMPKPQAACTLPATEGLIVYTDTEALRKDRKGVLEFLLINHPLDCPICDRGGECPLQNNTLFYGPSTSRYVEMKRHAPKAFPLSQYVTLDLERCIQCGRCVRFTEEISGDSQLAFRFRGGHMQPSTFELRNFDSKFSGNVIEICPVGALTNAKYRFRARPWDLQTRPGICTECSNGCNVHVDYRVNQVMRINGRTNEAVNEEWTCDRGKFGHYQIASNSRLSVPRVRRNDKLAGCSWTDAYNAVVAALHGLSGKQMAVLGGARNSNEDLYAVQRLFRTQLGCENLDFRFTRVLPKEGLEQRLGLPRTKTTLAEFEKQKAILVFGTSLADEEPILFLRIRKAWFNRGTKVVVASETPTDADSFAHLILRYKPGTEAALAAGLATAAGLKGADARLTPAAVEAETGVKAADIVAAAELLREQNAPIVATRGIYNLPNGQEVVDALAAFAVNSGSAFNLYALQSNEQGAEEMCFLPGPGGLDTRQVLEGCANGDIKFLWLIGVDPITVYYDQALVAKALENVEFLVIQDVYETEALAYASVALPMTAPLEADGTYTNLERRVQLMKQILPTHGEAKPGWRVLAELALRLKPESPLFNPSDVMDRIAVDVPAFAGIRYEDLPAEGQILA